MFGVFARIVDVVHVLIELGIKVSSHVFLAFEGAEVCSSCDDAIAFVVVETDRSSTAEPHLVLAFAFESYPDDAALFRRSKLESDAIKLSTIVVWMRLFVTYHAWC